MKTIWEQLKPEYKKQIRDHQENYEYAPQSLEVDLKQEVIFNHLPFSVVYELFTWTDVNFTELEWTDYFGERFLIKE